MSALEREHERRVQSWILVVVLALLALLVIAAAVTQPQPQCDRACELRALRSIGEPTP